MTWDLTTWDLTTWDLTWDLNFLVPFGVPLGVLCPLECPGSPLGVHCVISMCPLQGEQGSLTKCTYLGTIFVKWPIQEGFVCV